MNAVLPGEYDIMLVVKKKMILFDLDGTLLPMDQDVFTKDYFSRLTRKLAPHGYDPQMLIKGIWQGMAAMVGNDGSCTNEEAFWKQFLSMFGEEAEKDYPVFEDFYENDFDLVRDSCGYTPEAAETVRKIREMGYRIALATNPIFPSAATYHRIRWAGLDPEDFEFITTYENSTYCKPDPRYYTELAAKLDVRPEDCLMAGNDAREDLAAEKAGMDVFILTECLMNPDNASLDDVPHGSFADLIDYIRETEKLQECC